MDGECDYLFKAVLIGDSGVGKSNLLSRFSGDEFRLDSKPTIGVEFAHRTITIADQLVKVQIWDTAGQERFRAITSSYYRGALGALLVYDITQQPTFDNIQKWLTELREHSDPSMVIMLVGNKSDLQSRRSVGIEQGAGLAEREDLFFVETSALENKNVEEAFMQMIHRIHEIMSKRRLEARRNEAAGGNHTHLHPVSGQTLALTIDDEVSATKTQTPYCCHTA